MKEPIQKNTTSLLIPVVLLKETGNGIGKAGLTASEVQCYYFRQGAPETVDAVLIDSTTLGTWESGGLKEIDATNCPGEYEFGVPDAALVEGAGWVTLFFTDQGDNDFSDSICEIVLTDRKPYGGLSHDKRQVSRPM